MGKPVGGVMSALAAPASSPAPVTVPPARTDTHATSSVRIMTVLRVIAFGGTIICRGRRVCAAPAARSVRTTLRPPCLGAYDVSPAGRTGPTGSPGPPATEGTSRRRVHPQVTHPARTIIGTDSADAPGPAVGPGY